MYKQKNGHTANMFADMPSTDYKTKNCPCLSPVGIEREMPTLSRIAEGHGFKVATIMPTFGGGAPELVVYKRLDIGSDVVDRLDSEEGNYNTLRSLQKLAEPIIDDLHLCVNELDRNVNVLFETGWLGNCSKYGSDDVSYKGYCGIGLRSWSGLLRMFSPLITDVKRKMRKGVYVLVTSRHAKCEDDVSPR